MSSKSNRYGSKESFWSKAKGQGAGFFAGVLMGAVLVAVAGGCASPSGLVDASDRFANQTVGPEYKRYVEADESLSFEEKQLRLDNLETFQRAVAAAKGEPPPPAPIVDPLPPAGGGQVPPDELGGGHLPPGGLGGGGAGSGPGGG